MLCDVFVCVCVCLCLCCFVVLSASQPVCFPVLSVVLASQFASLFFFCQSGHQPVISPNSSFSSLPVSTQHITHINTTQTQTHTNTHKHITQHKTPSSHTQITTHIISHIKSQRQHTYCRTSHSINRVVSVVLFHACFSVV